jgi:hypothetical protein
MVFGSFETIIRISFFDVVVGTTSFCFLEKIG